MRQRFNRVTISTVVLLSLVSSVAPTVYAATGTPTSPTSQASPAGASAAPATSGGFNIIVSPVAQQLEVKPDGTVNTTIQVQNLGSAPEQLKALIYTFGAHGEDGTPQLLKPTANDEFIKWASLSNTQFTAEPNVFTSVKLSIHPPKTAAYGYYYAVIFSRVNQEAVSKQANLLGAAASLVLLNVQAPGAERKLDISEFSTTNKSMEFLPANFTVRMHNIGNTHVAPRGNIFITKGGQNVALLEVNQGKGQILPKSFRVFDSQWADGTPVYKSKMANGNVVMDKNGKPISKLSWANFNLSKLRFGKYTAKLVMVYNNGHTDISDVSELSFWVIPWRIIGLVILAAIVAVAGTWTLFIRPVRKRLLNRGKNFKS